MDSDKQNNLDVWTDDEDEILVTKLLEIKTSLASGDSFSPSTSVSQESWRDIANEINKICPNSRAVEEVRNRFSYLHSRFNELQGPSNSDDRMMWGLFEKMRSLLGVPIMAPPVPSLDQSEISLERKASRHWTYDEEKALIENILSKKRELGSISAKLTLSAWSQVTDDLNKSYSCSRSVEGIKKHYRKLRTKYLTEKSLGGVNGWAHYQKMADIVENETDNKTSLSSIPTPNTPCSSSSRLSNMNNSPSLAPITSIYDSNQNNRMLQTQVLGNSDNLIQQITQCQEKQKRTYDQTVQLVDIIAKRIKYDIELENEFLEVLKKMISN